MDISRRTFLAAVSAAAYSGLEVGGARAFPLPLPLGIQSYDLTDSLIADFDGTLRTLSGWGYQWIDWLAGGRTTVPAAAKMSPKDLHKRFQDAGLATHNVHFTFADLHEGYSQTIQAIHDFQATSVVCTTAPGRNKTADDWKWHADQLNALGERTRKDGVLTGYHTHPTEFTAVEGIVPFDLLLKTDPAVVKMQIDVGACASAGKDPVFYLTQYPEHYFSMHVKDAKDGKLGFAVGEGSLDWKKVLTAASHDHLRHYVVETSATGAAVMDKTQKSIDFLRKFSI